MFAAEVNTTGSPEVSWPKKVPKVGQARRESRKTTYPGADWNEKKVQAQPGRWLVQI